MDQIEDNVLHDFNFCPIEEVHRIGNESNIENI